MNMRIPGMHHATAIVNDPQQNVDFYADVLGLRLVKQTVNFDDPGTYHLYFGDQMGRPGTILTFFPWEGIRHGSRGSGQVDAVALTVPENALGYWAERFEQYGIRASDPQQRFGQSTIAFYDPAGLLLELVAQPDAAEREGWTGGGVPAAYAIRDIGGLTMTLARPEPTAALLTDIFGFEQVGTEADRTRYMAGDGRTFVDLVSRPDLPYGMLGAGSVHHIAWRAANDDEQQSWRTTLSRYGLDVSPVRDRQYFHSIYFREPGGVLFEIATDEPGFAIDEPPDALGTRLMLPPWMEPRRTQIERMLPPLILPGQGEEVQQ